MSTTPRIHRFDFNGLRDFRGPIVVNTVAELPPVEAPPPPPVFNEAQIEDAHLAGRKQGYGEGFSAGQLEARKQFDAATDATNLILHQLADILGGIQQRYATIIETESKQLSQLVLSIAKKVAGDAINERSTIAIDAMVEQCLPVVFTKPKLTVELNPQSFAEAMDRIEAQLKHAGFEGEVQFKSNPSLGTSDITLDWGAGQTERNAANLWAEVEAIIQRIPLELTFAETLEPNTPTGD